MRVTETMMADWLKRGLTIREAAAEVGMTVPSIMAAEKALGVTLRRSRIQNGRSKQRRVIAEAGASDARIKAWSASPAAIARALDKAAAKGVSQ